MTCTIRIATAELHSFEIAAQRARMSAAAVTIGVEPLTGPPARRGL